MHGQQISTTRRLNRHWQSGAGSDVLYEFTIGNWNDETPTSLIPVAGFRSYRKNFRIRAEVILNTTGSEIFLWAAGYQTATSASASWFTANNSSYKIAFTGGTQMSASERSTLESNGWIVQDYDVATQYGIHLSGGITMNRWGRGLNTPWLSPVLNVASSTDSNYGVQFVASTTAYPDSEHKYGLFQVKIQILKA